jgi:thiamine biosynthesis lipoprotein
LLGTFVEISLAAPGADGVEAAIDAAFETIASIHHLMSFHDPESDVSRINRAAPFSEVAVHPWTFQVLVAANELRDQSAGVFDIGVAPILQRRGLLPGHQPENLTSEAAVSASALSLVSQPWVKIGAAPASIDLGGIAKGFAVDRAVEVLRQSGHVNGLVNAGAISSRSVSRRIQSVFAIRAITGGRLAASTLPMRRSRDGGADCK